MKTSSKIASITTATALAVGSAVYFSGEAEAPKKEIAPVEFTLPTLDLPSLDLPNLELSNITYPVVNIPSLGKTELNLDDVSNGLKNQISTVELATKIMRDARNLDYSMGSKYLSEWLKIYEENKTANIKYIPCDANMRMVAEVSLPKTQEELEQINKNLSLYKKQNFNAVLLSFDTTENIEKLKQFAQHLKYNCKYDVYFTFGGTERLEQNIFNEPVKYKKLLTTLAKECKGFLLGWRRTSLHLLLPDAEWTNFHLNTLRKANKNLIILGEVYWGMTAKDHPKIYLEYNIPQNVSGVIVFNFGYNGINQEYVIKKYLDEKIPNLKGVEKIGVVIKGNKKRIAERFLKGGSKGYITCIDDRVQEKSINKKERQ